MQCYTVAQMREAEARTEAEYGIPLAELMRRAGECLAQTALEMLGPEHRIGLMCGNGNNGGDGYVCAAALLRQGRAVTLWGIGAEALPEGSLVKAAAEAYRAAGGVILPVSPALLEKQLTCGLMIDALLGTGLTRPVAGAYAQAVECINAAAVPVLSCDLPSGIDADTGRIMGTAVQANKTLMMGLAKRACALPPGNSCFGRLAVCDIGLPSALTSQLVPETMPLHQASGNAPA